MLLAWLAGFFFLGSGVWKFQAGHLMVIGYVMAGIVVYCVVAFLSRCPKCRMPVMLRPMRLFGMELYQWSLLAPEKCRHCGDPLR